MEKTALGRYKNLKAFTLIELLIVIAIIGILAGAILVAANPAKRLKQARDSQRKTDINSIANALVSYGTTIGSLPLSRIYNPPTISGCDRSNGSSSDCSFPGQNDWSVNTGIYWGLISSQQILKKLPIDPINNTTYYYWYQVNPNPPYTDSYWIGARLENPSDNTKPIFRCSDWPTLSKGCKEVPNWLQ